MPTVPLRLDADLVNKARSAALISGCTPTTQVEFWAKLGMVAEAVFSTDSVRKVTRIENLAEVIASANSPMGRARYATMVRSQGVPLYRSDPAGGGVFIETLPGGIERRGRFVNRRFIPF